MPNNGGNKTGFASIVKRYSQDDTQSYDLRLNENTNTMKVMLARFLTTCRIELNLAELTELINDLNDVADLMEQQMGGETSE